MEAVNPRLYIAQNYVLEAMAHHQLGQTTEARNAYEMAAREGMYPFAPQYPSSIWIDWLTYEINRQEAAKLLGVTDNSDWPQSPARARALAAAGDWQAAATEMARACTSPAANSLDFIAAGTLLARGEDHEAYRRHCQAMIDRFVSTQSWNEIERTVKVCSLSPHGVPISAELLEAVSSDIDARKLEAWLLTWGNTARAMAAYRLGRYDDAAKWAEAAASEVNSNRHARIQGFLIAALAQYRLGNVNAAKDRLLTAVELRAMLPLPKLPDGSLNERIIVLESTSWWDIFGIELMLKEAQSLIQPMLSANN
jgi:tetratricopeptide (TPR) repeat protein